MIAVWPFTHPVLAKGVLPFLLSWLESIAWVRPGIPSLAFHQLKEQTAKIVSVGCYSAYRACPSWYFLTESGALPSVHTCMNPLQRCQVWRQWGLQLAIPINLGSWRYPASPCPCHFTDVSLAMIRYGPDGLGVWCVLMQEWRHIGLDRGFRHDFCCDVRWPGRLSCS